MNQQTIANLPSAMAAHLISPYRNEYCLSEDMWQDVAQGHTCANGLRYWSRTNDTRATIWSFTVKLIPTCHNSLPTFSANSMSNK